MALGQRNMVVCRGLFKDGPDLHFDEEPPRAAVSVTLKVYRVRRRADPIMLLFGVPALLSCPVVPEAVQLVQVLIVGGTVSHGVGKAADVGALR